MIDPLEAVISYLLNDADLAVLTGARIAGKHQFGGNWATPSKALRLRLDGGEPEQYETTQIIRIEAICYGESPYEARRVWRRLVTISRIKGRRVVDNLSDGNAVLYWFNRLSGPSQIKEPDIDVDAILTFFGAAVSEVSTV